MKRLFTRCMMLLALLVMGVVTAFAQKSVLNESFESGTLPSGWTTAGSYWQFSANKAQFNGAFENAADTLVTPVVSLNELTNVPTVTLAYSLPANGSYVNTLQVLYRETEQSAWAELKTINEAAEDAVLSQALPAGLSSVRLVLLLRISWAVLPISPVCVSPTKRKQPLLRQACAMRI